MASFPPSSQVSYKGIIDLVDQWIRKPIVQRFLNPAPQQTVQEPVATRHSILVLPDGAKLAYQVLGSHHQGRAEPIVLICGMTSVWVDYERLTQSLIKTRPVLLYDHRGIGNSSLTQAGNEEITIELLARDLFALLVHVKWKDVALCGFSMGGVIAQQMLLLPHHSIRPTALPFRTTHLFLAGTRSVAQTDVGLQIRPPAPNTTRTLEEKKAIAQRVVSSLLDARWIESNPERFEFILKRACNPAITRPSDMIAKQGLALKKFHFADSLAKLSSDIQIMVIHGQLDQVIPFHCGEDILNRVPWARLVEEGNLPGQVPSLDFGHFWYEYFDIQVWQDVIDKFMSTGVCSRPTA